MLGPLTYLDVALIALALISGFLAMYRGFSRELLSILSWVAAFLAAFWVVQNQRALAEQLAQQFFQSVSLALIVMGAVVFIIVLIVVHFLTIRLTDKILDSRIGLIDRILGFGFGVVRGFLLVVIAYMFFDFLSPQESGQQFRWISEAQSLPMIQSTGETIRSVLLGIIPEDFSLPSPNEVTGALDTMRTRLADIVTNTHRA